MNRNLLHYCPGSTEEGVLYGGLWRNTGVWIPGSWDFEPGAGAGGGEEWRFSGCMPEIGRAEEWKHRHGRAEVMYGSYGAGNRERLLNGSMAIERI